LFCCWCICWVPVKKKKKRKEEEVILTCALAQKVTEAKTVHRFTNKLMKFLQDIKCSVWGALPCGARAAALLLIPPPSIPSQGSAHGLVRKQQLDWMNR